MTLAPDWRWTAMMMAGSVFIQPARFTSCGPTMARPTSRTRTGPLVPDVRWRGAMSLDPSPSWRRCRAVGEDVVVEPLRRHQLIVGLQREGLIGAVQCAFRLVDRGRGQRRSHRLQIEALRQPAAPG